MEQAELLRRRKITLGLEERRARQVKTDKSFLRSFKYIKCRRTKTEKIGKENKKNV